MFFAKKARRDGLELQLTAMIDIFTIIVIFLIKGTVMGVADLDIPPETQIPKSYSAEVLETSTQLIITPQEVFVSNLSADVKKTDKVPLKDFKLGRDVEADSVKSLKTILKTELSKRTAADKQGGVLLSVVADQKTPYSDVFDVVRVMRDSGFETLLFIAMNEVDRDKVPKEAGK